MFHALKWKTLYPLTLIHVPAAAADCPKSTIQWYAFSDLNWHCTSFNVLADWQTEHMSFIYKLKANFCGRKKEGHFHYKNFLRALKWVPTWYTYTVGTKSLLSDWLLCSESQSERSILCLPYVRFYLWKKRSAPVKFFFRRSASLSWHENVSTQNMTGAAVLCFCFISKS